jgi:hypothetical protein
MTLATPSVYIGTELMEGHALADMPVLAGLTFDWGNEDQIDFDDAATLSCQLLIRTPANTDFLAKGVPFGLMIGGATVWAGRITTLKAAPDKRKKDALLISLTAADTLADLASYRVRVNWTAPGGNAFSTGAATRREQIANALPPGWQLDWATATAYDWTTAREQRWTAAPLLPIVDMHLRSTLARRHITSRYVPGTGLAPQLTFTPERAKASNAETLAAGDGTWYMTNAAPSNTGFVKLDGSQVSREIEWEKTPDDTVTDVQLTSYGISYATDTDGIPDDSAGDYKIWVNQEPGVDNSAIQAKYGFHQVEFDVDTIGGATGSGSPHIGNIVNYWIDADAQWRPTGIHVPDSRKLPDATTLALLDVAKRYKAYATVDGLPANNPAGGSRVRAYIIAGNAEWTGKKWRFNLVFGRVPRAPATGGVLTFDSIKNHTNPAIANGTAETIGTNLSFADFAYIGA